MTAQYSGARDDVAIQKSLVTAPHSRVSVDGSIGKQLNVAITTTNLDDLFAALPADSRPPVELHGGQAGFTGKVTGSLTAPQISGHLTANRFSVAGRQFDSFNADASVTKQNVAIQNGSLSRNAMQARFSGTVGLRDWKTPPTSPLAIDASMQNGDLADLLALAGQASSDYSGQLSANVSVNGTIGNPRGAGSLVVTNGMALGQPFDRAEAQVNLTDQLVTVPAAFVQLGSARLNLNARYQHPRDSFTMGQLQADLQSDQINLAQLNELQKQRPENRGHRPASRERHWESIGRVSADQHQRERVCARAAIGRAKLRRLSRLPLTTSGQAVSFSRNLTSNFAGSNIRVDGNTQLTHDYPTTARATLGNLPVQRMLSVADRSDIPVSGLLSGTANFQGTIASPQGSADLTLANASIYDNAVDRVHFTAQYDQPGNLRFRLDNTNIDLARAKTLTERQPGLTGMLQVSAAGAAEIRDHEPRILVRDISGNIRATGFMQVRGKNLGDLTFAANTTGGRTNFTLMSGRWPAPRSEAAERTTHQQLCR